MALTVRGAQRVIVVYAGSDSEAFEGNLNTAS